jgi:hypothetical protein
VAVQVVQAVQAVQAVPLLARTVLQRLEQIAALLEPRQEPQARIDAIVL